jgi:hypothetical protein
MAARAQVMPPQHGSSWDQLGPWTSWEGFPEKSAEKTHFF